MDFIDTDDDKAIFETLDKIRKNDSKNFKIETLQIVKGWNDSRTELMKQVLYATYNQYIQYNIKKIPGYEATGHRILSDSINMLDALADRTYTGHAGIEYLQKILSGTTPNNASIIEKIIGRNLKAGFSGTTVNKIWEKFIPVYELMLCEDMSDKMLAKFSWGYALAQRKFDGMRANIVYLNGKIELRARSGKVLDMDEGFYEAFKNKLVEADAGDVVIDGELLCVDENGDLMDRKAGNGICGKAGKGTIKLEEQLRIHMVVWDIISYEDFLKGKGEEPYFYRLRILKSYLVENCKRYKIAEATRVYNIEEANTIFEAELSDGWEGIILKDAECGWENKRVHHQLKFKDVKECDLIIVEWQEGEKGKKYEGLCGALICETADGKVRVAIGIGFSDEQRKLFTKEYFEENLRGCILTAKYNEIISSKGTDIKSLFLGRFVEIRDDKYEANNYNSEEGTIG